MTRFLKRHPATVALVCVVWVPALILVGLRGVTW